MRQESRSLNFRKLSSLPIQSRIVIGFAAARLQFGEVEVGRNDRIERPDFLMGQVVLGETGIGAARPAADPRSQTHIGLAGVGTIASAAVCPCAAQCNLF